MLVQQLINGLVLGAIYCLFALGFTIIFGVLHVINLTYAFYFALGAYVSLWATSALGAGLLASIAVAAVVTGLVAVVLDSLILTPLRRREGRYLASLIATTGLSLFCFSLLTWLLGAEPRRYPASVGDTPIYEIGGVLISLLQISIIGIVGLAVAALFWFLKKARWGIAIRGVGDQETAALLVGLSPAVITGLVSFLAGAMAAIGGTLIGVNFNAVHPYMGEIMMLHGFAVIIIGGLGSMQGAVVAGLLLGVVQVLTAAYLSSAYREAITFALLLLVLWFYPQGLVPARQSRRA